MSNDQQLKTDLPGLYEEALRQITHLWKRATARGGDPRRMTLVVTDEEGNTVLTVPFTDMIERDRPKN